MHFQELISRLLDNGIPTDDRLGILRALQQSSHWECEKARIVDALLKKNVPKPLQIRAVLAMAMFNESSTIQRLHNMLKEESDRDLERAILATLVQLSGAHAVPLLKERLRSSKTQTRQAALLVAATLHDPGIEEALLKVLSEEENEQLRVIAAIALARWGRLEGADVLKHHVRHVCLEEEISAICALCMINQQSGFDELGAILDGPDVLSPNERAIVVVLLQRGLDIHGETDREVFENAKNWVRDRRKPCN